MHELSIALSLLEVVGEEAERRGAARVTAVHVKLGSLSGIVPRALHSAFELAREGSSLAEARLLIEEVPVVMQCAVCGEETPVKSIQDLCCERCGSPATEIVHGREVELVALEIET